MNERTIQHLLDADWHVVIAEQVATYADASALVVEPAVCGQWAAEQGKPCDPLAYGYTKLGEVETFIVAYNDTAALWAEMVEAKNEQAADTYDYDGALLELIDGIDDNEFWRRGQY